MPLICESCGRDIKILCPICQSDKTEIAVQIPHKDYEVHVCRNCGSEWEYSRQIRIIFLGTNRSKGDQN